MYTYIPSLLSLSPPPPPSHPSAVAAKSLQSCPTLCDPRDGSPPGSTIHGIFQARVLEWVAIAFSDPCMTTGKTIALTRWTFVGKVTSLLFNMLSRLVKAFLPGSKYLNFMVAVTICSDFGAPQNQVSHCFIIVINATKNKMKENIHQDDAS